MSDIRGLIIQSRLDYLEKINNKDAYNQILKRLSEPVRNAVGEQVFMSNLYPFHLLKDLDLAIGESFKKPLESIFKDIGENYAILILDRYFYNSVDGQDPQKFLLHLENLYSYLWTFGQFSFKKKKNQEAVIKFDYDEDIHKAYCWFMQSFLKKGIQICGGKSVKIKEEICEAEGNESCMLKVSWN